MGDREFYIELSQVRDLVAQARHLHPSSAPVVGSDTVDVAGILAPAERAIVEAADGWSRWIREPMAMVPIGWAVATTADIIGLPAGWIITTTVLALLGAAWPVGRVNRALGRWVGRRRLDRHRGPALVASSAPPVASPAAVQELLRAAHARLYPLLRGQVTGLRSGGVESPATRFYLLTLLDRRASGLSRAALAVCQAIDAIKMEFAPDSKPPGQRPRFGEAGADQSLGNQIRGTALLGDEVMKRGLYRDVLSDQADPVAVGRMANANYSLWRAAKLHSAAGPPRPVIVRLAAGVVALVITFAATLVALTPSARPLVLAAAVIAGSLASALAARTTQAVLLRRAAATFEPDAEPASSEPAAGDQAGGDLQPMAAAISELRTRIAAVLARLNGIEDQRARQTFTLFVQAQIWLDSAAAAWEPARRD